MVTLTYGFKRPETGDLGSVWFPAMEDNITRLDAHDHDGSDSPQLTNTGIASAAAITRSKLASGTAYRILANTSAGVMSENAALTFHRVIVADTNGQLTNNAALTAAHVIYADANGELAGEATLAISRGGTNAATANAGFNNLAPTTTKGDIIAYSTVNARVGVGADGTVLTASSAATPGVAWVTPESFPTSQYELFNFGFTTSVGASALTITFKQADGTAPSTGASSIRIGFRNVTATTGQVSRVSLTSATAGATITVPSTATMGFVGGSSLEFLYVYAINNAGTIEAGVCGSLLDESALQTSTTVDVNSDSRNVLYSTTGVSDKAVRLVGRIRFSLATAGTWDEAGDELSMPTLFTRNFDTFTNWTGYTPVLGGWGTTNLTATGTWRRAGANMEVQVQVATSGGVTAATLSITLPLTYTIDTTRLVNSTADGIILGHATYTDAGVDVYIGVVAYNNTTTVVPKCLLGTTYLTRTQVNATSPFTWGASDILTCNFTVPIVGWTS